ncbi:hypothetical protein [Allorhodopirellula heiligendammensis]|uniref:Secreted protein n=1 Tax=Allorhodopirellula heiligendammensis TaxID=2714739 RepID=A0A5C6C336_9BACT|nr:hypothetical protein [Allorhodopirellula heiligendammensis]TWU18903.1 hypothetical protein Poly21_10740 [Allorhodopirellula heiligendammensis]|tara:strand:- start:1224 stop:1418 length:195 start_codon:yes stop_codon:yes gene_type:complete
MLRFTHLYQLPIVLALLAMSCVGCGGSSTPEATSGDELSQYLDAHPELKETQTESAPADPRKSN